MSEFEQAIVDDAAGFPGDGAVVWGKRTIPATDGLMARRRAAKFIQDGLKAVLAKHQTYDRDAMRETVREFLSSLMPEPEVTIEVEDHPEDSNLFRAKVHVKNAPPEWVDAMRAAGVLIDA